MARFVGLKNAVKRGVKGAKGGFARLRDRTGKFAYNGGKKRKTKIKANDSSRAVTRYRKPMKSADPDANNFRSATAANKKFTAAKLGKAARFMYQRPEAAGYFFKNHYLAKAAYKRATVPFRNVRDTVGLNIPKPIRSRVRLVKTKLNAPINNLRRKYGKEFSRVWAMPETKGLALFAAVAATATAYDIYETQRKRRRELNKRNG